LPLSRYPLGSTSRTRQASKQASVEVVRTDRSQCSCALSSSLAPYLGHVFADIALARPWIYLPLGHTSFFDGLPLIDSFFYEIDKIADFLSSGVRSGWHRGREQWQTRSDDIDCAQHRLPAFPRLAPVRL